MRAGKLNRRLTIHQFSLATLTPVPGATVWASIRGKETGAAAAPAGLRGSAPIEIRVRQPLAVAAGDYAISPEGHLFHLFDVRDPDGRAAEWIISAHELRGSPATYTPPVGAPVATRAFVQHDSPYLDAISQTISVRTRIELPVFETGRIHHGVVMTQGVSYPIHGLAENGDDGVIRQYWSR